MTDLDSRISEDELHAYADGVLPADRVAAVEAYLAADAETAARVNAWRQQATLIRARWQPVTEEPIPDRLRLERIALRASGLWRKISAAALIAFVAGGVAGWFAHEFAGVSRDQEIARAVADAALEAHRLYINEVRHPIEVRANEEHLLRWLSRRVGSPVRAPDLSEEGLKLLGGRLLPGPKSPTALIMYEGSGGERVTVTCTRAGNEGSTSFYWRKAGEIGALAWVEGGLAFVVAGPAQRERLDRVARRVYEAYETASTEKR
jgi:anti-sigma factor RsiW